MAALKQASFPTDDRSKTVMDRLVNIFTATLPAEKPFRHWLLRDVLPDDVAYDVVQLPFEAAEISETYGKRDTHNASRHFFNQESRLRFPVCADIATAFQSPNATHAIETSCNVNLAGSFLRIEYCQDSEGFWLEPHTDIGVKIFTMLIYLTDGPRGEDMGTDIYDSELTHCGRAPSPFNSGLIFIPADNTWHGFEKRPMPSLRRSIIINYVKPEWRSRHELAFPEQPISAKTI